MGTSVEGVEVEHGPTIAAPSPEMFFGLYVIVNLFIITEVHVAHIAKIRSRVTGRDNKPQLI